MTKEGAAMLAGEFIQQWAQQLTDTPLAQAIASSSFLFPLLETVHVIGLGLVIGSIAFVDLRLLGLASMKRVVRDVAALSLPIAWAGFVIAVLSGLLMFTANAASYVGNRPFQLKLIVLALAGLNMAAFHRWTWTTVAVWDEAVSPPAAAKVAGAVSLSCWIVIVFLGRWIGFVE